MKQLVIGLLLLSQIALLPLANSASESGTVLTIGSKTFTESVILGEILQHMAQARGVVTSHKAQLGGTHILWNALLSGEIDLYPEYTGSLMRGILAKEKLGSLTDLKRSLLSKGIRMTEPLGFNNTYAIGITEKLADSLGLSLVSNLRDFPQLKFGFTNEFMDRADGWPGLQQHYSLPQKNVTGLDHDLAYRALEANSIQVMDLYATDAEIQYYHLRILKDDQGYFPEYHAVILYRDNVRERYPQVTQGLGRLEGKINAATMVNLNADVKLNGKSESIVAKDFLAETFGITSKLEVETDWLRFVRYSKEHLILVLTSLFAAIVFAIPLGILAALRPRLGHFILAIASMIQTIPALALFVFMIPLLGIGGPPAVVALFLYSLLPIIRNTYAGLTDLPSSIRESAQVLGLSVSARLRIIELPLATRAILAGIKTSAVINVGTATLGAIIGAGGYGQAILTGIRLDNTNLILQGAIPAALLALLVQGGFEVIERYLLPRRLVSVH